MRKRSHKSSLIPKIVSCLGNVFRGVSADVDFLESSVLDHLVDVITSTFDSAETSSFDVLRGLFLVRCCDGYSMKAPARTTNFGLDQLSALSHFCFGAAR